MHKHTHVRTRRKRKERERDKDMAHDCKVEIERMTDKDIAQGCMFHGGIVEQVDCLAVTNSRSALHEARLRVFQLTASELCASLRVRTS
jgi:hypothetical protein